MNITTNYYRPAVHTNVTTPNFKGALSDREVLKALNMLKTQVTDVRDCKSIQEFKNISDQLMSKYSPCGINSVGAIIVPERNLAEFLGEKAKMHDLTGKTALCVAVGDKHGPVETWNKAYEAIVALCPKSLFK